jgi:hypothetical protein
MATTAEPHAEPDAETAALRWRRWARRALWVCLDGGHALVLNLFRQAAWVLGHVPARRRRSCASRLPPRGSGRGLGRAQPGGEAGGCKTLPYQTVPHLRPLREGLALYTSRCCICLRRRTAAVPPSLEGEGRGEGQPEQAGHPKQRRTYPPAPSPRGKGRRGEAVFDRFNLQRDSAVRRRSRCVER